MDHKHSTKHWEQSGTTPIVHKKEAASRGTGSMEPSIAEKLDPNAHSLRETVKDLQQTVRSLQATIEQKDGEIMALRHEVNELQTRADDLEQHSRRASVEQSGTTLNDHKTEAASRGTARMEGGQSSATPIGQKTEAASRGKGSMEVEQSGATPIGQLKKAPSRGTGSSEAGLGDLAVEMVFPTAAFIRLADGRVRGNEEAMRRVREGESVSWPFIAGSRAEGVAVEPGWGHLEPDADCMKLFGEDLAVGLAGLGELPPGGATLRYRGEGCPPAYTRLEVVDRDRLLAAINMKGFNKEVPAHTCVWEEGGRQWLLSRRLLDAMRHTDDRTVSGPAAGASGSRDEFVTALVGTGPHPDMAAYSRRPRTGWPTQEQITDLLTLQILIVCVGPKGHPDSGCLFRVSFSPHEIKLINDLVPWMKQGYICFKHVLKALLTSYRCQGNDDGRSRVGSYHLKTVFLRYLEEHPPQPEGSPFQLALDLCLNLQQCLLNNNVPHYFIPECNLLEKVGETERQQALSAVDRVLRVPLAAIICSPLHPEQIFGSSHNRDNLLRYFRALSNHPACGATREALQHLLWELDQHRVRRYSDQLRKDDGDERERVSGRPWLVQLTNYMQQNIPV